MGPISTFVLPKIGSWVIMHLSKVSMGKVAPSALTSPCLLFTTCKCSWRGKSRKMAAYSMTQNGKVEDSIEVYNPENV